jgi:glutaredoxin
MVITIKKNSNNQELDKMLLSLKPRKSFPSTMFLGKIKWGEDALEYQKRIRDEWD